MNAEQFKMRMEEFKISKGLLLDTIPQIPVLDHGYVKLIDFSGSDEGIIEAARMSTGKGFLGWGKEETCERCGGSGVVTPRGDSEHDADWRCTCMQCAGQGTAINKAGDEKLLRFLWEHRHETPFEMGDMTIEVKAPIFVFREWHRHRTQSYNEMSARYIPLPDENYCPTVERIVSGAKAAGTNRQAQGLSPLDESKVDLWLGKLQQSYLMSQKAYEYGIEVGIPKELARLSVPVARYSRMRAKANLRNWIGFLMLRYHPKAQPEIQEYAVASTEILKLLFARTMDLFEERRVK